MTPDVNVLVAASRADHAHHVTAKDWLTQAVAAAATFQPKGSGIRLMGVVVASFLRLVTHPKIFVQPTPLSHALDFADALLACPGVGWLSAGGEWDAMRLLCAEQQLGGNDIPDAWIAASTLTQGEVLVTFDRDFRKLLPPESLLLLPVN